MYARVYDPKEKRYYKSIVYCAIGQGYDYDRQYVVLDPEMYLFRLVDYLDKSTNDLTPLVEIIQDHAEDWRKYEKALLLKHKAYWKSKGRELAFDFLWGYRDVCERYELLMYLLDHGSAPVEAYDIQLRELSDMDEWAYILTEADVKDFMKTVLGFHDGKLQKLIYEEDFQAPCVTAVFDTLGGMVELCFEGVKAVHLCPPKENYMSLIYEGTLIVKDELVFWADTYMETEDLSQNNDCSYIKALSLKWRKLS